MRCIGPPDYDDLSRLTLEADLDIGELRARLRKMSDRDLLQLGRAAAYEIQADGRSRRANRFRKRSAVKGTEAFPTQCDASRLRLRQPPDTPKDQMHSRVALPAFAHAPCERFPRPRGFNQRPRISNRRPMVRF